MPDSPKCPECENGQTYRIAGTQTFKCSTCKNIFLKSSFEPQAFLWKDKPGEYKVWDLEKKKKDMKSRKELKNVA